MLAAQIEQNSSFGRRMDCKVLDVRDVDVRTAHVHGCVGAGVLSSLPKFHPLSMETLNSATPEEMASSDPATPATEEGEREMGEVEERREKEETLQSDSDGRANVGSERK